MLFIASDDLLTMSEVNQDHGLAISADGYHSSVVMVYLLQKQNLESK